MNMLELLIVYRDSVRADGRVVADDWLAGKGIEALTYDDELWRQITGSVNDEGEFVDSKGNKIDETELLGK